MGRKIRTTAEAKSVMHWIKELTGVKNLEDAITLGFHRVTVQEQAPLEELRDIYLMHIQGHINPHICLASADRSVDKEVFLANMETLIKTDLNSLYVAA